MRRYRLFFGALVLFVMSAPAFAGTWSCTGGSAGVQVLAFRGGIDEGENQRFEQEFVKCFPRGFAGQRVIDLNSGGGYVNEALAIARTIVRVGTSRPIQTQVSRGSVCISACTYLFVAGQFREVAMGGSFEPHGFSGYLGTPIDRVLDVAAKSGESPLSELQTQRLFTWAPWLAMLAESDPRFQFAEAWLGLMFNQRSEPTKQGLLRMLEGLSQLTPAQRLFVSQLDGVARVALPELERVAALHALEPAFAGGSPRSEGVLPDEARYLQWITGEFDAAARMYLRSIKDTRAPKWGDAFGTAVRTKVRQVASGTMDKMVKDLWPYISSRSDIVNEGFLRLMFSTSILYMRPLTREEMCAFNIVNENCYE